MAEATGRSATSAAIHWPTTSPTATTATARSTSASAKAARSATAARSGSTSSTSPWNTPATCVLASKGRAERAAGRARALKATWPGPTPVGRSEPRPRPRRRGLCVTRVGRRSKEKASRVRRTLRPGFPGLRRRCRLPVSLGESLRPDRALRVVARGVTCGRPSVSCEYLSPSSSTQFEKLTASSPTRWKLPIPLSTASTNQHSEVAGGGVRCEVSGVRCEVSGVRCQVSGVRVRGWHLTLPDQVMAPLFARRREIAAEVGAAGLFSGQRALDDALGEDDGLQQRVARQAVGAVDAGAGGLAAGVEVRRAWSRPRRWCARRPSCSAPPARPGSAPS